MPISLPVSASLPFVGNCTVACIVARRMAYHMDILPLVLLALLEIKYFYNCEDNIASYKL